MEFTYDGGAWGGYGVRGQHKFYVFVVSGDEEIMWYSALQRGMLTQLNDCQYESRFPVVKIFMKVATEEFGKRSLFYSFYVNLGVYKHTIRINSFDTGNTEKFFEASGSLLTFDAVRDILGPSSKSVAILKRQPYISSADLSNILMLSKPEIDCKSGYNAKAIGSRKLFF